MTISPARLAANRANAQRSSGPKTDAGKARSRMNAFQHGRAGAGDLVGPGEDVTEIERRSAAFARELEAPGEVGRALAHRAALLSVRMEACSTRDLIAVAANAQAAREAFDLERLVALEGWIKTLEAGEGDPIPALSGLEGSSEGITYLLGSWLTLRSSVNGHDRSALDRARLWLGQTDSNTPAHLIGRIDAEVTRLRHALDALGDDADQINAQRHQVGLLAGFDPSPEATLARRYEAAAERGMYRALRAIADLRRDQGLTLVPDRLADPTPPPSPRPDLAPPTAPTPAIPQPTAPTPGSLGSFRVGHPPATANLVPPLDLLGGPLIQPPTPRKKRLDSRQLQRRSR